MNKTDAAKMLANLPGFKKRGQFYIGTCNGSVISGYALDAPVGSVYIWRFVLPSYDDVEFLHLSLGRRIIASTAIGHEDTNPIRVSETLRRDWSALSEI